MARISLDEFVERLQSSVAGAQANIEKGGRGRLERLIEIDQQGRTEALTCSFVIDADPATGLATHTVQLPLFTLRPFLAAQVNELKLDLSAAVEESPRSRKMQGRSYLRLVIGKHATSLRRHLHRLTINLTGQQPGRVAIAVDGVVLKSVGTEPFRSGAT
jgi:hypothetical protein